MSKELIEKLREAAEFLGGRYGEFMSQAADALEAKAAPVGEREAFEAWISDNHDGVKYARGLERVLSGERYASMEVEWALRGFQAGAAHQRAQQPQSAEAVVWIPATSYPPFGEIVLTNIGPAYMTEKIPGVWFKRLETLGMGTRIGAGAVKQWREIDTPQPSAGVVMPPLMPSEPFTTIDRGSKNFKAGWNAYAQEFARLNGKEVV